MALLTFDLDTIDEFVEQQQQKGSKTYWDGWDVVIWKHNPYAFADKRGAFKNGRWGMQLSVAPNEKGEWRIPSDYILDV